MKKSPVGIFLKAFLIAGVMLSSFSIPEPTAAGLQPAQTGAPTGAVLRVATDGVAAACGSDWATPCNLEYALTNAAAEDELWVKEGVYKPTLNGVSRDFSFLVKSGVKVYGGFAGGEAARNERSPLQNVTVFSGDIDNNDQVDVNGATPTSTDIAGANAYHVVRFGLATSTTALDGVIITGGQADGAAMDGNGGGLLLLNSNPALANLVIVGNLAVRLGGGMHNDHSSPTMFGGRLEGNEAGVGGGMHNAYSNPVIIEVDFLENQANYGGGMANSSSSPQISDVTFSQNIAVYAGGGMDNTKSSPTLSQVDFHSNQAQNGGGMRNTDGSSPSLDDVSFTENHAYSYGGGMRNTQNSTPKLEQVSFQSNQAVNKGGGMDNLQSSPVLDEVTFFDNLASSGGGMSNSSSQPVVRKGRFRRNHAISNGGGMFNDRSDPVLAAVVFEGNQANQGGGIWNSTSRTTLMDVVFSGNAALAYGGGMTNRGSTVRLSQVTFAANHAGIAGGAFENRIENQMLLYNAIIWGNTAGGVFSQILNSGLLTISNAIIQGGCPSLGSCLNVQNLNPGFLSSPVPGGDSDWGTLDDDYGDLRVIPSSPAIDGGGNNQVPKDLADLNTNLDTSEQLPLDLGLRGRITGTTVDLGAYEALERVFLPIIVQ